MVERRPGCHATCTTDFPVRKSYGSFPVRVTVDQRHRNTLDTRSSSGESRRFFRNILSTEENDLVQLSGWRLPGLVGQRQRRVGRACS
jgi:hypothetical protein